MSLFKQTVFGILLGFSHMLVAGPAADSFYKEIDPILVKYCHDCHADGVSKGDFALDGYEPKQFEKHLKDHHHWHTLWQNVRSEIMPPSDKKLPTAQERARLLAWIEQQVFRLDPKNPDPGRVTIRRLNRAEYQNTIQDLFGFYFNTSEFFPADDTGHGFDTIGDVLSMSPLITQKYLDAAQNITAKIVVAGPVIPETSYWWNQFKSDADKKHHKQIRFDQPGKHSREFYTDHPGEYQMQFVYRLPGADKETDNTGKVILQLNGKEVENKFLAWGDSEQVTIKEKIRLEKGKNVFTIELVENKKAPEGERTLVLEPYRTMLTGPLDGSYKVYPGEHRKIFIDGAPPSEKEAQKAYADKLISHWGLRILRRPVPSATKQQLQGIYQTARDSGLGFESSFKDCLTALLASPGFIFRAESQPEPNNPGKIVPIDEFSLASRLSYFLWSTTPDERLLDLAGKGQLRASLDSEIQRMLKDGRINRFVENFTGQWLQTRDIQNSNISAERVLQTRDENYADRYYNYNTREAMKQEIHSLFSHILKENRPVLDFLIADYTFVNEPLALVYGMKDVKGKNLQRVVLPADSPRGGILGTGGFLMVTSNPTRTSPVKRGLFVLEQLLATPAPPAPAEVPPLETQMKKAGGKQTMREMMEMHRKEALCASCHARMDPIGLALENFNALGMWRDTENNLPISVSGQLVTGESFSTPKELARILATSRRKDFYRCLAQKLLTYGLGRGIEYFDAPTVDAIVGTLETKDNHFQTLIKAVIYSPAFQKRRGDQNH